MRSSLSGLLLALVLAATAQAQQPAAPAWEHPERYYQPPGVYVMAYGYNSYGMKLNESAFSSPYGGGYGRGLPTYRYLPGALGASMWRPEQSRAGWAIHGYTGYRTFAAPGWPDLPPPPVGAYAPAFGPPAYHVP